MKRNIVFVIAFLLFLPSFSIGNENKRYEKILHDFFNYSFEKLEKMFENNSFLELEEEKKILHDLFENIINETKMTQAMRHDLLSFISNDSSFGKFENIVNKTKIMPVFNYISFKEFEKEFEAMYNSFKNKINEKLETLLQHHNFSVKKKIKEIYEEYNIYKKTKIELNIDLNNYTPHPPIYINGNDDFIPENGVIAGNGTKENPYIIEGWEINASNTDGIRIENTDAYFIIRNCYIYGGKKNYNDGINFYNVKNGGIENVICKENYVGIRLYESSLNKISNSSINKNEIGFIVAYSPNNIFRHNQINNNTLGFYIYGNIPDYNQDIDKSNKINGKSIYYITHQTNQAIFNKKLGFLALICCRDVIVRNIYVEGDGILVVGTSQSTILECTIVGGLGIQLINSSYNNIRNCIISSAFYGLLLEGAIDNEINNCIIYRNRLGIGLYSSHNNNINSCSVEKNTVGIDLGFSNNNSFRGNRINNNFLNFGYGYYDLWFNLPPCEFYQDIDETNTINGKPIYYIINKENLKINAKNAGFIALISCNNVTIEHALIKNNLQGLLLVNCNNLTILNSSFSKDKTCIDLFGGSNILIINCTMKKSPWIGSAAIWASETINIVIKDCKIYNFNNESVGIYFSSSIDILISQVSIKNSFFGAMFYRSSDIYVNNSLLSNNTEGIMSYETSHCFFTKNICMDNVIDGIRGYSGHKYTIEENICNGNFKGIAVENVFLFTIKNNTCCYNRQGILLNNVSFNNISSNKLHYNDIGIYLYNSSNNTISYNSISYNSYNGIALQKSNNNSIYKNNISNYNCIGIMIEESYENRIIGNDIINNEWIGIGLIKTAGNKIHYNNIYENRMYGMGGAFCWDNACFNYWGSMLGPGFILNNKFWEKTPCGNPIACFGRVKRIPWKIKPVDINNDTLSYEYFMESVSAINLSNDFEMEISPGIYIFNRKIFSLPETFIFIDGKEICCSKFNEKVYEMLMEMKEKVSKNKNGI